MMTFIKRCGAFALLAMLLCACSVAGPVELNPPPAWAENPADLPELLDGTLADAVRFAVFGSSGWKGETVGYGEAVPVYALRGGQWQRETELTPYYTNPGTPAGFLYPLEDGALRAKLASQDLANLAWWRYERQEPGPVCFLATSEGVVLWCETGRAIPFWNEPTPGLDPAPDWDVFTSPGLACVQLAESERISYNPAQFARYDPLADLRTIDGRWTGEICEYGCEYERLGDPLPLTAQALAKLSEALAALPLKQQKAEEIDGVDNYEVTLRSPAGETFTLALTPQVYHLEACDGWGYACHIPLAAADAAILQSICETALATKEGGTP